MPPISPPLTVNPPKRIVVLATSSCSHRKYQGAFAGFGVIAGSPPLPAARPKSRLRRMVSVEHGEEDQDDAAHQVR